MDIKTELRNYKRLLSQIDGLLLELELWDARGQVLTGGISLTGYIKSHRQGDRLEKYIEAVVDIKQQINEKIKQVKEQRRQLELMVSRMTDETSKAIIEYRYFCNLDWISIAEKMNFSVDWLFTLHGRALDEMRRLVNE